MWNSARGAMVTLSAGGAQLEGRCLGPAPDDAAATVVMLHEGLGCTAQWRDFPDQIAQATGCGVFAYSRRGYGGSDPVSLPRPLDYMTNEAERVLPEVLDAIGFRRGVVLGHSDGASIAAVYGANSTVGELVGLVLLAPHFFTEDSGLDAIARVKESYLRGTLRDRLARYHNDVDGAFHGWSGAWLDPGFRAWNIEASLPKISVPVLAIQGVQDEYGTVAQFRALQRGLRVPLQAVLLEDCGHAPHRSQPERTLQLVRRFCRRCGAGREAT